MWNLPITAAHIMSDIPASTDWQSPEHQEHRRHTLQQSVQLVMLKGFLYSDHFWQTPNAVQITPLQSSHSYINEYTNQTKTNG